MRKRLVWVLMAGMVSACAGSPQPAPSNATPEQPRLEAAINRHSARVSMVFIVATGVP